MLQGSDFSPHLRASPCPNTSGFPGKAASLHTPASQQPPVPRRDPKSLQKTQDFFLSGREDKEGNDRISNSSGKKELCFFEEPNSIPGSSMGTGHSACSQNPCPDKQHPLSLPHPFFPQHPPLCRAPSAQKVTQFVFFCCLFPYSIFLSPNPSVFLSQTKAPL